MSAEVLGRVPYFGVLPRAELRRLAGRCTARRLGRGQVLFEEDEPCRGLFIVAEGLVEIRQTSARGREQVFHTEGPGATLGEGPLFDGRGYIATAVALAPTRVLFLLETMARRLRRFAGIVSDLAFHPVTERLAPPDGGRRAPRARRSNRPRAHPRPARRAPGHGARAGRACVRAAGGERRHLTSAIARGHS